MGDPSSPGSKLPDSVEALQARVRELEEQLRSRDEGVGGGSTEQLRTLFEQAPFSIQLIDANGRTLAVNRAWKELWGIPEEVVQSYILREYDILEDPQLKAKGLSVHFDRALAGENAHLPAIQYDPAELRITGRARWVEGYLYPVKDAEGRVTQLVLIHADVTAAREAQELILRKSAEFAALFEHLPEPVVMVSAQRQIVLVNPAANALLGYAPGELTGKPVELLYFSREDFDALGVERHHPNSSAPPASYEMRYRHKSGEPILTETTASVVRTEQGEVIGFVGILRDIRQRRREEQLARFVSDATDVLASSLDYEQTLSTLVGLAVPTLGEWCFVDLIDPEGVVRRAEVLVANPELEPLRREAARYAPSRERPGLPPARALFEGKAVLVPRVDLAEIAKLAHTDDHARIVLASGVSSLMSVPLIARGRTVGALTVMSGPQRRAYDERDLESAKQLAHRAAQAVENARLYRQATLAINARDEFLSVASHELKTPLTSMKLQLELAASQAAQSRSAVNDVLARRIGSANRALGRLDRLIDDMLDVSRIVTGKLSVTLEPVSLRDVVAEAAEPFRERFAASDVPLTLHGGDEAPVQGDRFRLAQIVVNLLSNALKYGAGKPVSVTVGRSGGTAFVEVADQGVGIAPEDANLIFTKFERTPASRASAISGLGLGLYISRQIAELHGGSLEVESAVGQGAKFTLRLPTA